MKKIFTFLFTILVSAQMWAATGSWPSGSATVTLDDNGTVTITGISMADYTSSDDTEWSGLRTEIKKVVAENGVDKIGQLAFANCVNLESVELANTVYTLKSSAFSGCGNLKSVTLPEYYKFKLIGHSAFKGTGLTTLTIPSSVEEIAAYAFFGCIDLQYIRCKRETPPAVVASSFQNVPRTIPLYVPLASLDAYKNAAVWGEFNVLPDPEQCPTWGYCGLEGDNLKWELDCEGLLIISGSGRMASYTLESPAPWNFQAKDIKTIIVSEGVTTIGAYAFYNCKYANSLTLPNSLLSIGRNAFNICQKITSIVIPSSVATIGQYAFSACNGLTSVRILGTPAIESGAFQRCNALASILCASEIPPVCSQSQNPFTFIEDADLAAIKLSVPVLAIADYQAHEIWSKFDIQVSAQKKILFVQEDGKVLKTEMLDEGAMPNADELTPTKDADEDYVYEFAGWLPTIKAVEQDYVYVTHFVRTSKKEVFNATIKGENCKLEIINQVPEGTVLTVKAVPDECLHFTKWSDDETANPRTIIVKEDTELTAEFDKVTYTITDESQNGHLDIAPQQ